MKPEGVLPIHKGEREDLFLYSEIILNQIWKIKNKTLFINESVSLEVSLRTVQYKFEKAKDCAAKTCSEEVHVHLNRSLWNKPPLQFIKISSDATVKNGSNCVGLVARNYKGEILKIKSVLCQIAVVELAEAYGVLQGLHMVLEEG